MKMSDVFNTEMTADDINVYTGSKLIRQGGGEDKYDCADRYAANAINCHDDLVDALQALMDWQVKNVDTWHHPTWDNASRVIKKAKGEQ